MKANIKKTLLIGAVALGMASCNENSWNDKLDGFEGGPNFTEVKSIEYTLTAADYDNLAKNSTNIAMAKAANVSDALAAVGKLGYFNGDILPADYVPAFLKDPDFQYFTLNEGSAINLTYKIAKELPDEMKNMNAAGTYTVTTEDYQAAYGSDENYAESFSPLAPASANIPRLLKSAFPDAVNGNYAVVNYNNSETSPVFGSTAGSEFEMSDVLKDAKSGDELTVDGVVTGICARGFILTDKGGSILYYNAKYDNSYAIGDQVEVSGKVGAFNLGLQFSDAAVIRKIGTGKYTYPEPKYYDGAAMDAAIQGTSDFGAIFCRVSGKVSVSGNYYNLIVDGASTAQGSFYQLTADQKAMLKDGETMIIYGYFLSVSKSGSNPKFFNILMTNAESAKNAPAYSPRKVASIANTATTALYLYDGSAWAPATGVSILQKADYAQMGVNVLTAEQAEVIIPQYLANKFPYASAETVKMVVYATEEGYCAVEYTFDDSAWTATVAGNGVVTETNQFVYKAGSCVMDPSINLVLPAGKNQATSTWFYQAVVDWVNANIPDASVYVDRFGTAEYYSGCSSYQGNVNINASYATLRGLAPYNGMTDDEMVALMKKRFETETGPGALSTLYPNMAPIGDLEPTVTIKFTAWTTGSVNKVYTIVFKCTAKAKFEFVSCDWNDTTNP